MWKTKNSVLTDANRTTATQISDSKGVSASKDNQQASENQNTDKKDTTLASQAKAWVVKQFGVKAGSIHIITDVSQIPASQRAAIDAISKGIGVTAWVSGDIYLYLPNILEFAKNQGENALDNIKAKVFHELVAHKNLKEMLGAKGFSALMGSVWNDVMSEADKAKFIEYHYTHNLGSPRGAFNSLSKEEKQQLFADLAIQEGAADEFVAHFAEKKAKGILTKAEQSTWDKILALFKEILSKIGLKNLTEQDLENIILASYQYSVNSGNSGTAPNANSRFSAERRLTDKIESIFEDVVKGNLKGKPISIGKLSAEGRDYLLQISGINFKKDVDFVLNPSDLQHIYNEHYGENEKDKGNNIPLSMYDIRRIVDVIMYPDEIVFGVDEKGRKVFAFLMESSNGTYNLFEIYADAKGNLTSKSYYKTKKGVSQRAMSIKNSLHSTSKTDEATLFDAKIPQLFDSSITNDNNSRFSISERKRTEYELQIKKHNKTISDEQLKESLDFLDELEDNKQNTKAIKIAVKWLADGTIMLPYGMDNIRKAIALCEKNGIDPMSFKDPMEIINKYSVDVEYGKAVDPDKVSVFTDKRIITTENGDDVVVYDVEDSVAGQEAVCRICHQHFGYSTKTNGSKQPWCLASFTRQGEPTQSAQRYWHNTYTSVGKKIAFMDGKPIAFMAHSESYEGDLWWDLNDQSSNNLPLPNGDYILPDGEITERYSSDDADITDDAYEEAVHETASLTTTSEWCDILQFMYGKCIYEGEYRNMPRSEGYFNEIENRVYGQAMERIRESILENIDFAIEDENAGSDIAAKWQEWISEYLDKNGLSEVAEIDEYDLNEIKEELVDEIAKDFYSYDELEDEYYDYLDEATEDELSPDYLTNVDKADILKDFTQFYLDTNSSAADLYNEILDTARQISGGENHDLHFSIEKSNPTPVPLAELSARREQAFVVLEGVNSDLSYEQRKEREGQADREQQEGLRFSIDEDTKMTRSGVRKKITAKGISEEHKEAFLDYLDTIIAPVLSEDGTVRKVNNPEKKIKSALDWFNRGTICLPEDSDKVDAAFKLIDKYPSIDIQRYKAPMEIINNFGTPKKEDITIDNPLSLAYEADGQKVNYLSNPRTIEDVTIYDFEDDPLAAKHFSENVMAKMFEMSPWCLMQFGNHGEWKGKGYWNSYTAAGRKVAFRAGRPVAFWSSKRREGEWWDLSDSSHGPYLPVAKKIEGDVLGRTATYEYNERSGAFADTPTEIYKGSRKDGVYTTWYDMETKHYEDVRKHRQLVKETIWHDNGQLWEQTHYKNGKKDGEYKEWYDNGQIKWHFNYKDGRLNGEWKSWYDNGQLDTQTYYENGKRDGEYKYWDRLGGLSVECTYKNGEKHGEEKKWNYRGELITHKLYKNGIQVKDYLKETRFSIEEATTADAKKWNVSDYLAKEMSEIKSKAEQSGALMKAPNGKQSNLNERNWLLVRTNAFKQWFGDWETNRLYNILINGSPASQLSGKEFLPIEGKTFVEQVAEYFDTIGGKVNSAFGEVILDKKGVKNSKSHGMSREKAAAFASIKDVLEKGVVILPLENHTNKPQRTGMIAAQIEIDREKYICVVEVIANIENNRLYVHEAFAFKKLQDLVVSNSVRQGKASSPQGLGAIAKIVKNIVSSSDCSEVIDTNGEPRIVYHGTPKAGFSIFDNYQRAKTLAPEGVSFFTDDLSMARSYAYGTYNDAEIVGEELFEEEGDTGPGIYKVFLNLRPKHLEYYGSFEGASWDGTAEGFYRAYDEEGNLFIDPLGKSLFDSKEELLSEMEKEGFVYSHIEKDPDIGEDTNSIANMVVSSANDNAFAIIEDVVDYGGAFQDADPATIFIVKNPNQIKSATENQNITNDPDIRFSIEEQESASSRRSAALGRAVVDLIKQGGIEVSTDAKEMQEIYEASERLSEMQKEALETESAQVEHHPSVVSSASGAKILNNLGKLAKDYLEKGRIRPDTFIGDLAKSLGMANLRRPSQYKTFETKSGKIVTIRLSNHNAKVSNFDSLGEDYGISIIISSKPNQGITNDGNAHLVEYYYNIIKLRKAEGQPLVDIIQSIKQSLYSGEYKDTTGLAEVQEVNDDKLQAMTVFHGSGAKFDRFDHSYMGTGEGTQFLRTPAGEAYGFVKGGKIYLDPKHLNPNTPIHEYTHLWDMALQKANPELWKRGVELLKQTTLWNEVKSNPAYSDIADNDNLLASEVHARLTGKAGAELIKQMSQEAKSEKNLFAKAEKVSLVESVKRWLSDVWNWVRNTFAPWSKEQAQSVSLADFTNMPLKDLAEGTKISEYINGENAPIRYSIRTKPAPKHTNKAYKLFKVDEQGRPHALFIDSANPVETGVWLDADSPNLSDLEKLDEGVYLVDAKGNATKQDRKPSKKQVEEVATSANGSRYMNISHYADGTKKYENFGINGSGSVGVFALRPGWHITNAPSARHIGAIGEDGKTKSYRRPDERWFEVEYAADVDYNAEAKAKAKASTSKAKGIDSHIPEDGYYEFQTNSNANPNQTWIISGAMRIVKPLTEAEAHKVSRSMGIEEDLPYKNGVKNFEESGALHEAADKVLEAFRDVVNNGIIGKNPISIGSLTPNGVEYLRNLTGWNFKDNSSFVLNSSDLKHIYNDHFGENEKDKGNSIPLTENDISSMVDVIAHPDDIVFFEDKKHNGRKTMYFLKADSNGTYNLCEVVSSKRGTLTAKTLYKTKRAATQRVMDLKQSLLSTSETYFGASSLVGAKIPQLFDISVTTNDDYRNSDLARGTKISDTRFSIEETNERFNAELQQQIDGTLPKGHIYQLGRPLSILKSTGFSENNIEMSSKTLDEHSKDPKHAFDLNDVKDLPKAIQKPLAAFKYGKKEKAQNLILEVQQGGKNYLVGIHFNQERRGLVVSDIRGIFPKDNAEWLNWISQRKLLYANKEKIQALINQQRKTLAEVEYLDLDDIAKIINDFENPKLEEETLYLEASSSAPVSRRALQRQMRGRVEELSVKLHLSNVEIVTSRDGLEGKRAKAKGIYTKSTGKITIVLPNNAGVADVEQTLLHEAVAHYGLRELFGEGFDAFLDEVYTGVDTVAKQEIDALRRKLYEQAKGANKTEADFTHTATEEYLATLAETTNFEKASQRGLWEKIKQFFSNLLNKLGIKRISDNDLRYTLWRSYQNLTGKRNDNIFTFAGDVAKQYELKVGEYAEVLSRETDDIRFSIADTEAREVASVRDQYERRLAGGMYQTIEALQDNMRSLKEAMQMISGKEVEDIAGFENAYIGENRLSSKNKADADAFARTLFKPMLDEVASLAPNKDAREELIEYLFAKHGLERNVYMAERDAREAFEKDQAEHPGSTKTLQDYITKFRSRDYAGLTALTGLQDVQDAEVDAQQMVDEYEAKHGTTALWQKLNAVSAEILKVQYEAGLMSRERYEAILGMYKYYVPLRGFEQETAEQAYAYLNHKGSSLNAPIRAEGRSSVADDPFANLEAMAESAIMRSNRNILVKRRFWNFVQNHPSDLVSVSDLWLKYDDVNDEWKPIFPDNIKDTDTPEEVEKKMQDFEEKMKQLCEEQPERYKSASQNPNIPYKLTEKGDLKEHQVLVKRAGQDYILTINGNPRLAQALNGLTNPDNDLSGAIGKVLKVAKSVNRELSAFYTTRNPDFVLSNFLRDTLYANSMVWVKENWNYALRFNANYLKLNPVRLHKLFTKYENGTLDMNNETERQFDLFMRNGGETGYTTVRDIEKHKNDIQKALKQASGRMSVGQALQLLGEKFDRVNRAVENCARFAAFVTSREFGRDIDRSIYDAKEISVNFNKKGAQDIFLGAKGQTRTGTTAASIAGLGGNMLVFWNAGVQGLTNYSKQYKKHPGKALAAAATLFGFAVLVALLHGEDDDDDYFNLPEHIRRDNLTFKAGASFITIPLPVEYRALYGLGELAATVASGKAHYDDKELAKLIAGQVTQILPLDFMEGEAGAMNLVPSFIRPIVEVIRNKDWTDLPIYKDNDFNKTDRGWEKAYKKTSDVLVETTKSINDLTNGAGKNPYDEGKIDLNPAVIEHYLKGYFGGWQNMVDKLVKSGEMILGDREFNTRDVLFLNRVIRQADERTTYRSTNNEYARLADEAKETTRRLNKYINDTKNGIFDYAEKINFMYYSPEFARAEIYKTYNKHLKDIYDTLKVLKERNDPADAELIKDYEKRAYEIKQMAVEAANETRPKKK